MMKKIIIFIFLAIPFVNACSIKTISLQVARPARVDVPAHIKSMVIINRTNATGIKSTVEAVLTGEILSSDKNNVEECLNGLQQFLSGSKRYTILRGNEYLGNNNSVQGFTDPLSWTELEALCQKYNVDAVLTLEYFDSDFVVTKGDAKTIPTTGSQPKIVYTAKSVSQVNAGFRIYDVGKKSILYQDRYGKSSTANSQGATIEAAIAEVNRRDEAIKTLSYKAGQGFAKFVIPAYVWEDRSVYKGKSNLMKSGLRAGLVNDWATAIDTWYKVVDGSSEKEKGEAAFNLALAYEVIGNLTEAKKWVQKAYIEYGIKKAEAYSYVIDTQIANRERVNKQLSGEE